ncbi:response regulator, partial [Flagellimonas beolgyonensis]|uniref:response regulator n=1 Tax=Flagellimonas beolgyonensis TaxID=864064 RepID=UPI003D64FA71
EFLRNELEDSTPVIIMSTAGNESNVLNAFEMGAGDFVSKPVSPSELLVRVGKLLRQRAN